MYELIQLTPRDYCIDCPAKIGVVRINEEDVVLIDSGSDKDAGRKVLRVLQGQGWRLKAIFNTHSHADHIGGNRFLQDRTGCAVYAPGLQAVYAANPVLEPMGLYGGLPFKELQHKFLMAQESRVQPLTAEVLPAGMRSIPLPGHCFEMTGYLTPDGTAYIGDCVSSAETLQKYGIGYLWDAGASIATLQNLKGLQAARFVPAHAPMTEDIVPLAEMNIQAIEDVRAAILRCCDKPVSFEQLLKQVFDLYGLTMNAQQYVLIGSTLRSYLSGLYTEGKLTFDFEQNEMRWMRTV